MMHVETREIRTLYESQRGACCGVATWHPHRHEVAFILGPEVPTDEWTYAASRRQGVIVSLDRPQIAVPLDARDLVPPYTAGALRGGSHVHIWSDDGERVSFTYEDQVSLERKTRFAGLRDVGVAVMGKPVSVPHTHLRNHDGSTFSVLVTRSIPDPRPDSEEYSRASEEGWIGTHGYVRSDGSHQRYAIAFQGHVRTVDGEVVVEAFIADLPDDLTCESEFGPLQGTPELPPMPPRGVSVRRLTWTQSRRYPGIQGPRHWLRSSPDGSKIGMLMRDEAGVVQFWTVSPVGNDLRQCSFSPSSITSCFTWHPDGRHVALVVDGCVCELDVESGRIRRITKRVDDGSELRPEACVYSPDGTQVACVRRVKTL